MQAELAGDLDAAVAGSRAAHRADCPVYQAAATELMLARALIGEGLYQHVPEFPPADEQIVNMLVAPVDDRGDRPAIWSPDRSQCCSVGSNVNAALQYLKWYDQIF